MAKVVLAYSGGLDTSICIPWLKEHKNVDVVAFSADVGQGEDLTPLPEKAKKSGAVDIQIVDLRERFVAEYVWPALRAGALYGDGYLLATALSRPLIAAELVRIAEETGAEYISHGCTGKGNDQVRFEASVAALAPGLKVIAPLREWDLLTRDEEIEYAAERGIPVPVTKKSPYSYDRNLWGISIECGVLEDPWERPPEDAYLLTKSPADAPDEAVEVEIGFDKGLPVSLDGEALGGVDLIERLNSLGAEHGVGRLDVIEDRLVGIKSREVYEAPAGAILDTAHKAVEALCLPKMVLEMQRVLALRYGRLVYNGLWFSLLREAMDAFFDRTQSEVAGSARIRLFKGTATVTGRKSDRALYDKSLSTYDVGDRFDRAASEGFVKLCSLPLGVEGARGRRVRGK
ncbi:MAG: argininosuccinate synthase [Planctomycetota bacterium]|jgi:argininosuccinate synthase